MFGYVRPFKPNLRMREFAHYRALYCGLCHAIRRRYGQLARLTVGYDLTFLVLLLLAFADEDPGLEEARCVLHSLRARPVTEDSPALELAAASSVLLASDKLDDNLRDGERVVRSRSAGLTLARARRRARQAEPELAAHCQAALGRLVAAEARADASSANAAAAAFGELLAGIVRTGIARVRPAEAQADWTGGLSAFAESLGAWVYLIDALADRARDRADGRYNALEHLDARQLHRAPERARYDAVLAQLAAEREARWPTRDERDLAGYAALAALEAELDRLMAVLPIRRHGALLANIVQEGLAATREQVMAGEALERL